MNNIKIILTEILEKKLNISPTLLAEENYDEPLTGKINLSSKDMIYLYYFILERFNISIDTACFKDYGFNTINSISRIVDLHCNQAKHHATT